MNLQSATAPCARAQALGGVAARAGSRLGRSWTTRIDSPRPRRFEADGPVDIVAVPVPIAGTRVCFSDSEITPTQGPLDKEDLHRMAESREVVAVPTLTKTKTDALVVTERDRNQATRRTPQFKASPWQWASSSWSETASNNVSPRAG